MSDLKGLVKPLFWEHHPCGWVAAPPTGRSYIIDTRRKGKFEVIKGLTFSTPFPTLEAAKAAAQADYEARLLAALDLAKVEALVEAAEELARRVDHALKDLTNHGGYTYEDDFMGEAQALGDLYAALAAMKGGDT
jgi:hypothetical protein